MAQVSKSLIGLIARLTDFENPPTPPYENDILIVITRSEMNGSRLSYFPPFRTPRKSGIGVRAGTTALTLLGHPTSSTGLAAFDPLWIRGGTRNQMIRPLRALPLIVAL